MPRLLFEKTGNAIWMSHLDLMRLFQRAFKRAGLLLKHSQGYNPKPVVSIALPLSVGVESECELLDFELENMVDVCQIKDCLNEALVEGVRILDVYENGRKIKELSLLRCCVTLEYDAGVPADAADSLQKLFSQSSLVVEKKGKNGVTQQDIAPMIKKLDILQVDTNSLEVYALICCQNPSLNPMQLIAAIKCYLPEYQPDFAKCRRLQVYDVQETIFR